MAKAIFLLKRRLLLGERVGRPVAYVALPMVSRGDFSFNREYVRVVESLGLEVASKWVESWDDADPREVFERDLRAIDACDVLVADVSEPSHGVGMEVMYAYMRGKRVVLTARRGSKVSRMLLGLPGAALVWYGDLGELRDGLRKALRAKR